MGLIDHLCAAIPVELQHLWVDGIKVACTNDMAVSRLQPADGQYSKARAYLLGLLNSRATLSSHSASLQQDDC